ncbi:MAG: class I tRNA ligase family protein [Candidatus Nealsonbacteria bacterium]|nr:class I tRNA ligase family protein [Candidatus Nealsonbacteria bacterium]
MELNFSQKEQEILKFWKEKRIFEKSILQRKNAKDFVFYEGPPTANGKPGIHHVLSRAFKDIICRYKTMRGFRVLRKAGWDTHGLPVELAVEKKLGLKNKKDIEKFGIAEFNKQCKESVWQYKQDWEKLTERIGYWLDMDHPYITYENDYIETLWWIIKQIWQKKLLYKDYKVIPYCPRCGTSLSSHEVAQGYKKVKENSIYVKFKVKKENNTYLLVWTTTPWTLPGNVAVAINKKFTYVKIKVGEEYLILAKERMAAVEVRGEVVGEIKGDDLIGLEYERIFERSDERPDVGRRDARVVAGDFVSLTEGTGIVHIAPAFGEDDMRVGKENHLPVLMTVDQEGKMIAPDYEWDKMFVKDADFLIIKDLKEREIIFKEELYEHDYPFCWRCNSPLLYYAKESWFIKMQDVKKDLIENNQKVNWVPAHLKEGRFGEWLKDLKDWAFSRERYWGTPLPIWQCLSCSHKEVIGGKEDLFGQKFSTNKYYILRHGYSLRNHQKVISSWPEVKPLPLTKKGEGQIKLAARKLKKEKIDLIFSSDILRARQTAEIVSKELGAEIEYDLRLRDINLGDFNGKPMAEFYKVFNLRDLFWKRPLNGEDWPDCKRRMFQFVKNLEKKYKNKRILIVSHGDPLWLLEGAFRGWTNEQLWHFKEGHRNYIGTGEFRKIDFKDLPYDENMELDFHRPYIDGVKFYCPGCQSLMQRSPEVVDVWFDSGSMPFAQSHYPFSGKIQFPADYISEAIDQTRGWCYTLLAVATLLGKKAPYKNVISQGHVLDGNGEKMSKSKGNVVDPWYIIEKYGVDAARWYFYTVNQPGDSKLFTEKDVDQVLKKFILIFWNCFTFYQTYKEGKSPAFAKASAGKAKNILDKWVVSRLNELIRETTEKLDEYDVTGAARSIEDFVINDLSLWYIRRSRKRFKEAAGTLSFVLQTISKLTAPFIPFLSEEIYLKCALPGSAHSVHLDSWPKANVKLINKRLNQEMARVREIVASALAERAKAGIKVRQPLASLLVPDKIDKELSELIKDEVNVKKIIFSNTLILDTKITPELKKEGEMREIVRNIRDLRKEVGVSQSYVIKNIISTIAIVPEYMSIQEFKKEMGAKAFKSVAEEKEAVGFDAKKEISLAGKKHFIWIKK